MAAREYYISDPYFGAGAAQLNPVAKKAEEKQQKELLHLAATLRLVEKELASAKSGAAASAEGPSNGTMEDVLAQLAGLLQDLQVKIAKYAQSGAADQAKISKAELKVAQDNLKQTQKELEKLQTDEAHQKTASFWEKFAEGVLGAVMFVAGLVTAQPELLIGSVLCFAGAFGALGKLTEVIAKGLEEAGMSKKEAQIVAGVIVTVATIVLTLGTGAASGLSTAVDEGEEIAETVMQRIKQFVKISPMMRVGLMAGFQACASTGLAGHLVALGAKSEQGKQEAEMIAGIVVAILSVVLCFGAGGGGNAADASEQLVEEVEEGASTFRRLFNKAKNLVRDCDLVEKLSTKKGQQGLTGLRYGAGLGGLVAGGTANAYKMLQGGAEQTLARYRAATELNNTARQMNNKVMESLQRFVASVERGFRTDSQTIQGLLKGYEAFAELLTQGSPV